MWRKNRIDGANRTTHLAFIAALLPTPTVGDSKSTANRTAGRENPDSQHHDGVTLRLLPTPRTSDANGGGQHGDGGPDLRTVLMPTPTSRDHKGQNQRRDTSCLPGALTAQPSPDGSNERDDERLTLWTREDG